MFQRVLFFFIAVIVWIPIRALATVDVQGQASVVVRQIQTDEFFIQTVPTQFCVGIAVHSLAAAITQPVTIQTNYGCGNEADLVASQQINAATCAILHAEEVFDDAERYNLVRIRKDLSQCGKLASNAGFLRTLDQAIYNTFNANGFQVIELN